jgi:hypothetical protein
MRPLRQSSLQGFAAADRHDCGYFRMVGLCRHLLCDSHARTFHRITEGGRNRISRSAGEPSACRLGRVAPDAVCRVAIKKELTSEESSNARISLVGYAADSLYEMQTLR